MTIYQHNDIFSSEKPGSENAPRVKRIPAQSKDGRGRPSYKTMKRGTVPETAVKVEKPSASLVTAVKAAAKEAN